MDHDPETCFFCILAELHRFAMALYLDEVLGTPGRTLALGITEEGGYA